jgi:hypothetical protein
MHCQILEKQQLNMVKMDISALSEQCLGRRIGDIKKLAKEVSSWERKKNSKVNAREKFYRHYLDIQV